MTSFDVPPSSRSPAATGAGKPALSDLPVLQAPASLTGKAAPTVLAAEVKSHDAQSQTLILKTEAGDIAVRTTAALKPGTEVKIEIATQQNGRTVASLTLQKTETPASAAPTPVPAQTGKDTPPPAPQNTQPPVKSGDTTSALFISGQTPPKTSPPASGSAPPAPPTTPAQPPVVVRTISQAVLIVEQMKIRNLTVPLPPALAEKIAPMLAQDNAAELLMSLDVEEQKTLLAAASQKPKTSTPPPASPPAAPDDDAIAAVMLGRAMPSPQAPTSPSIAPVQNALGFLKALLPFLQTVTTTDTGMPAPERSAQQTHTLSILSVTPPAKAPATLPPLSFMSAPPPAAAIDADIPVPLTEKAVAMPAAGVATTDENVTPATQPAPTTKTTPPPTPTLTGIIDSRTPDGTPVLKLADGYMILRQSGPLDVGTLVTFTLSPPPITPPTTATSHLPLLPLSPFSWPALTDALAALMGIAPQLGQNMRQTLPEAGAKFVPTTLFFMAALKTGDIANWIGDPALNTLRQAARKGLAERLAEDFRTLSRQSGSTTGDWRGMSLPLLQDEQVGMMQIFMRQQPLPQRDEKNAQNGDDAAGPQKMTRFVLNLTLSRMGDVQLDGLVKAKVMDMILRTQEKLPPSMHQELLQAYAQGMDSTGMEGSLIFQTKAQHWIDIREGNPA